MAFLRPEVKVWLVKWKEPLISLIITLAAIKLAFFGLSNFKIVLIILGSAIALIGICGVIVSYIRISFSTSPDGTGLIEVKEKQIAYFDHSGGLIFSSDNIISIELTKCHELGVIWRLVTEDGSIVDIPRNALGNEKLFDVFMTLPKIDHAILLSSVKKPINFPTKIWTK